MYQKQIKEDNERKVLHYIYDEIGEISIKKVSIKLGISLPTVKKIFQKFIEEKIILETKKVSGSNGRRYQEYVLNKRFSYSIGIAINLDEIVIVLTNVLGDILEKYKVKYTMEKATLISTLTEEVGEFIENLDKEMRSGLTGIGIAIPGVAIKESDLIEISHGIHLGYRELEDVFSSYGCKVYIENKSNCMAIYERIIGVAKGIERFSLLNLDSIISMSTYNGGNSMEEMNFFAGRIEHMSVNPIGRECSCGEKGCLGTYISKESLLTSYQEIHPEVRKVGDIFTNGFHEEGRGREVYSDYLNYLSMGIRNILYLYNPEKLVISGEVGLYYDHMADELEELVYRNQKNFFRGRETLVSSTSGIESSLIGASLISVIDNYF